MRLRALLAIAVFGGALTAQAQAAVIVHAELAHSQLIVGETTSLTVTVDGASVARADFAVPPGLEVLGSDRGQTMAWVNGQTSVQTVLRYQIEASAGGEGTLGPFRVTVGRDTYEAPAIAVTVRAAAPELEGAGASRLPVTLVADANPSRAWVGQAVILRVRLIQHGVALADRPEYEGPSTTGFWTEPSGPSRSYFADERGRKALVTEVRTRVYPVAPGAVTAAPAEAVVIVAPSSPQDLFTPAEGPRQQYHLRSAPITVIARALPGGAPAGFTGAVGVLSATWSVDRGHTPRDVAVAVELDVRGAGNVSLLRPPHFEPPGWDVFAGAVDDSLGPPGNEGASRRAFHWTLLAKREGRLDLPPPAFAWFDPERGQYRSADLGSFTVAIEPALHDSGPASASFPIELALDRLDPTARRARPWACAAAGLLLGGALAFGRPRPKAAANVEAEERERWRAALAAGGVEFWRNAESVCDWLAGRGQPVGALRDEIARARYGGVSADPRPIRSRLEQRLAALKVGEPAGVPRGLVAALLALAAAAALVLGVPLPGDPRAAQRAEAADQAARAGDLATACRAWAALWHDGDREAALAARLASCALRDGDLGAASAWAWRGARGEPRDPALEWAWERVREAGGLAGGGRGAAPVRSLEWAIAALLWGLAAGALWPRRGPALALAALALVCGVAEPAARAWDGRYDHAAVRSATTLEGARVDLEAGQIVIVKEWRGDRARVEVARGIEGWLARTGLEDLR